jgi:uncharacterized protein DUF6948
MMGYYALMKQDVVEIELNGVAYVRKDSVASSSAAVNTDGLPCVIVAAGIGGIHFGFLKSKVGTEVVLVQARRVQYWSGAASISEMAARGVSKPNDCRFSMAVPEIILTQAVEIIPVTTKAQANLASVPVWTR